MGKYIVKRLLMGVVALLVLATITFFMMKAIPGNPFSRENKAMSPSQMEKLNEQYGLDKPILEQYLTYMGNALQGNFGESIKKTGQTVISIIAQDAPVTARLGAVAFVIALVVGIGFGMVSALTKSRVANSIITILATFGVSFPSFLLAMLAMILFGVNLKWLPLAGLSTPKHYILPAFALALSPISMITRLTRSSLTDVMNKDYITA